MPTPKNKPNRGNRTNWGGRRENQTGRPKLDPNTLKTTVLHQRLSASQLAKFKRLFPSSENFRQFLDSIPEEHLSQTEYTYHEVLLAIPPTKSAE